MPEKAPAKTAISEEQKTKITLTLKSVLDRSGLDAETGQYLVECGKHRFLELIEKEKRQFTRLTRNMKAAIDGSWSTHIDLKPNGLITYPDLSELKFENKPEDWWTHTTHFGFYNPDIEHNDFSWATMEEVCAILHISSKLVALVWEAYCAEDVIAGLMSEEAARKKRMQVIIDLFPFPGISWNASKLLSGSSRFECRKQTTSIDRNALREICWIGRRALLAKRDKKILDRS